MPIDELGLVAKLQAHADLRAQWDRWELGDKPVPDAIAEGVDASLLSEAAAAIERLLAERDRCHVRLEIDHYFKLGDNDDQDLERVEIPMDERAAFPDGISARDATIELLQDEVAAADLRCGAASRVALEFGAALKRIAAHSPATSNAKGLIKIARQALQDTKP